MESLSDTIWDVVVCGTGIRQSLVALALSRPGKKILHIDQNKYYGGTEAAFSLQDGESWIHDRQTSTHHEFTIEPVSLWKSPHSSQLGASRSYTLTLSPHLIYSQSALLPVLVSSRLHTQLDFQAVGPWWICKDGLSDATQKNEDQGQEGPVSHHVDQGPASNGSGRLQKIPSTREDVFADNTISARDKRTLMRFLRSVLSQPVAEAGPSEGPPADATLPSMLTTQFGMAPSLQQPLMALSLSYDRGGDVKARSAISRIRRHMRSIGAFGAGFGAVMPKYGGAAEIAQVACRASAVGGAVYVLGRGLKKISTWLESEASSEELVQLELSDGEEVKTRFVIGCAEDLPTKIIEETGYSTQDLVQTINSISVVSSPLEHLFPLTSEGGPVPNGAVVVTGGDQTAEEVPAYLVVHSSDSGECPHGQCVIYASTLRLTGTLEEDDIQRLDAGVARLLDATPVSDLKPEVLWSLKYRAKGRSTDTKAGPVLTAMSGKVMMFPPASIDLAFDDSILESVKEMWKSIMGDEVEEEDFMKVEERGVGDEGGS